MTRRSEPRGRPERIGERRAWKNGSLCPAMLDHVFTQLVASHRHAFEAALLQRQAVEERFQVDVFLGDVSFETSYSLPGEERPARIRVDTSFDWPTWSQTSYRSWAIGEEPDELPEVLVEIAFRVQGLDGVPEVGPAPRRAPRSPRRAGRRAPGAGLDHRRAAPQPRARTRPECAIEVSYEGSCQLDEAILDDPDEPGRRPRPPGPVGGLGAGAHRRPALRPSGPPPTPRPDRRPAGLGRPGAGQPKQAGLGGQGPQVGQGPGAHVGDDLGGTDAAEPGRVLGGQAVGDPVEEAGGEEVAGPGGVDHPFDRGGRHRHRARRPSPPRSRRPPGSARPAPRSRPPPRRRRRRSATPNSIMTSSSLANSISRSPSSSSRNSCRWCCTQNGSDTVSATGGVVGVGHLDGLAHGRLGRGLLPQVALEVDHLRRGEVVVVRGRRSRTSPATPRWVAMVRSASSVTSTRQCPVTASPGTAGVGLRVEGHADGADVVGEDLAPAGRRPPGRGRRPGHPGRPRRPRCWRPSPPRPRWSGPWWRRWPRSGRGRRGPWSP